MRLALASCDDKPEGMPDDLILRDALRRTGFETDFEVWSDQSVDWSKYDTVLIRSTWDYHKRITEFLRWIDDVSAKTRLLNPASTIRWNSSKKYLVDLERAGTSIVPSQFATNTESGLSAAQTMLREYGTVVLKPTVSATSHLTFRVSEGEKVAPALEVILENHEAIIQPFISSVLVDGEASLIFFNRGGWKFSHALVKRATPGDYRVQVEFGGTSERLSASRDLVAFALQSLEHVPAGVYARVDLLDWKSRPLIGEIEMIEPNLFFRHGDDAAESLVEAIRSAT